jgi:hypothetical protein
MVDEGRDVVGHESDVDRPIDVDGTAVPLEVGRDDLVALGEGGDDRFEHLARAEPAVEQDDWWPGPVGLVVELDAIDVGVLAGGLGPGCFARRHRCPPAPGIRAAQGSHLVFTGDQRDALRTLTTEHCPPR